MSIDERLVTTALHAYTRDLHVTDLDLDRLEARIDERLHPAPGVNQGRRRWDWAVAACAVVALVLGVTALWRTRTQEAVPATPTPNPITSADLTGVWMVDEPGDAYLWYFTPDGRRATSDSAQRYFNLERDFEEYTLEPGGVLRFVASFACRAALRLTPEGRMTVTPLQDNPPCPWPVGQARHLIRVSPASVAGTAMVENTQVRAPSAPTVPASMTDLDGTWLLAGTGTTVVVRPSSPTDGEYILDDDGDGLHAADQRGTLTLRPGGGLVLHPTAGAALGCDTVFERVLTTGIALRMQSGVSSCGQGGGNNPTWIRLN